MERYQIGSGTLYPNKVYIMLIRISNHKELPRQYAYRTYVVDNESQALIIADSTDKPVYYWRDRNYVYIPTGMINMIIHDTDK